MYPTIKMKEKINIEIDEKIYLTNYLIYILRSWIMDLKVKHTWLARSWLVNE